MNKKELSSKLAKKCNMTEANCSHMIDALVEIVTEELSNHGEVKLVGFGTFDVVKRKERVGRNPHEPNNTIIIPEKYAPRFRPGQGLKNAVVK